MISSQWWVVFFFNTFYILDHVLISPTSLKMTFSFSAFSTHPACGETHFSSLDRWTCNSWFFHRRSPLNPTARGNPVRGKEMPIKKLLISRNHTCLLWICAQAPQQRQKLTLSTTLCHSYIKLQHGAPHLSSPLGLCSRNTRSVAENHWHSATVTLWPTFLIKPVTC